MEPQPTAGPQPIGDRLSFAMTGVYGVGMALSVLVAVLGFAFNLPIVGVLFMPVFLFCSWQESRWRKATGYESWRKPFVLAASDALDVPKWVVGAVVVVCDAILMVVVPAIALFAILR